MGDLATYWRARPMPGRRDHRSYRSITTSRVMIAPLNKAALVVAPLRVAPPPPKPAAGLQRYVCALVLRVQRNSLVKPRLRRWMLNAIGARLHPTSVIQHGCWLESSQIEMGAGSHLNAFAFVDGSDWLILEEGARVGIRATILTRTHRIEHSVFRRDPKSNDLYGPVILRRGVWAGLGCTFFPGVDVGEGCVIGAGSIVTQSTEPNGEYVNAAGTSGAIRARRIKDLPVAVDG